MGKSLSQWKKKFWTKQEDAKSQSKFWLKDNINTGQSFFNRDGKFDEKSFEAWDKGSDVGINYIALGRYLRAVSNFVYIQTQRRDINVVFKTGDDSYTDGKTVTLSPKIKEEKFDVNVGLALHEAGHIQFTDFDKFKKWLRDIITKSQNVPISANYSSEDYVKVHKTLWNFIEDRFIDASTYREAPGYRGYYKALYNEYFNDPLIVAGMFLPENRVPIPDNYIFHIINSLNPQSDYDALPGLRDIVAKIDRRTILRLKNTEDRLALADECAKIVLDNCFSFDMDGMPTEGDSGDSQDGESSGNSSGSKKSLKLVDGDGDGSNDGNGNLGDFLDSISDEDIDNMTDGRGSGDDGDESDEDQTGQPSSQGDESKDEDGEDPKSGQSQTNGEETDDRDNKQNEMGEVELTENQKKKLQRLIDKQMEIVNNNGRGEKKGKLSKSQNELAKTIADADLDVHEVADESGTYRGVPVIRINRIADADLKNKEFTSGFGIRQEGWRDSWSCDNDPDAEKRISAAIQRGRQLANKLRLRTEDRVTDSTRKDSGRLDKRLLHQLGVGEYRVFKKTDIEAYTDSYLHISIDSSGSMHGQMWNDAVSTAATIATAAVLIKNIRVVISTRSTTHGLVNKETPFILTVFDSKVDGISRIRKLFPRLTTIGTTPEGLAFNSITKAVIEQSANTEAFFINISDGLPNCSAPSSMTSMVSGGRRNSYSSMTHYGGQSAVEHTKRERMLMEKHGVKVISYYLNDSEERGGYYSWRDNAKEDFRRMYGDKNAHFIKGNDIFILAKTINQKLMEK